MWHTFLTTHVATLVSIDSFTVPTRTGRLLFVFVLLAHHRRRIVHVIVTEQPTATWTAQQMSEAFPDDTAPRWLVRDRDASSPDARGVYALAGATIELLKTLHDEQVVRPVTGLGCRQYPRLREEVPSVYRRVTQPPNRPIDGQTLRTSEAGTFADAVADKYHVTG